MGADGDGYVLDDLTLKASPDGWGFAAIQAYDKWQADRIVAEKNQGGDMVAHVIQTIRNVPVTLVTATRGKALRAEPISALYEQHRVHHVGGNFERLEDQMTTWTPNTKDSPDRLDALVWALTDLMVKAPAGIADVW
jgi:predicted phage terminase large subunit-like protein